MVYSCMHSAFQFTSFKGDTELVAFKYEKLQAIQPSLLFLKEISFKRICYFLAEMMPRHIYLSY